MSNIVERFRALEANLTLAESLPVTEILAKNDISSRMIYLRQELRKRNIGFSMTMASIANDNTIDMLNSAQLIIPRQVEVWPNELPSVDSILMKLHVKKLQP